MPTLKDFLEECSILGLVRAIANTGTTVFEVKTHIEKLYYAELPKGKYANMHTDLFEFHLNMDNIAQVKFETGEAKRGNFTTYAIRLLNKDELPELSIFVQWGKPGEYEPGQLEGWQSLKDKYGEIWTPASAE